VGLQATADPVQGAWEDLVELVWRFDAHIQDRLTAASETQANGYQLGRGLAETYWALDPGQVGGSAGWGFLLGDERCAELSRLAGRLAAYMGEYTAPAIAGSVEVWKDVAATPAWRGDGQEADQALYRQIRRWYELIILGQDPTTLIKPYALMKNYRTACRALRLFWPQLVATIFGLGFLVTLLVLLSHGSAVAWEKTLSGILAAAGLSLAGITGTLKNSAQALLKRLRQDAYTSPCKPHRHRRGSQRSSRRSADASSHQPRRTEAPTRRAGSASQTANRTPNSTTEWQADTISQARPHRIGCACAARADIPPNRQGAESTSGVTRSLCHALWSAPSATCRPVFAVRRGELDRGDRVPGRTYRGDLVRCVFLQGSGYDLTCR
jgi:hypothetical protein